MARTIPARANLANAIRWHPDDHKAIAAARAELATENIAGWIQRKLAEAPPLSEGQLSRIRAALPPDAGHAAT